jgi:sarcosine oxidase subunit alpha
MVEQELAGAATLAIRVDGGAMVNADVVPTPFYDPDNLRQKQTQSAAKKEVAA